LIGSEETRSRNTFAATKISLCDRSSYQGGVVERFNQWRGSTPKPCIG
jgi:hypothetical protein